MKQFSKTICLASFLLIGMHVYADEVTIGSLKYELNGAEAYVIGYVGEPTDVVIPETIESEGQTFRVTQIKNEVFLQCASITSLTSNGGNLTSIGTGAFQECPNLKQVKLVCAEKSSIGSQAFYSCAALKEVNLTCSSIYYKAFANCTALQKVDLSEVNTIGGGTKDQHGNTFGGCSNLSLVNLGDKLESVYGEEFKDCSKLTYIVIPSTCTIDYYYYYDTYYNQGWRKDSFDNSNLFPGCTRLQSIIYLGNQTSKSGSNATVYHPKDQINWNSTEFDYKGIVPTATFTYDMPAGFVPTADMTELEKNAGSYTQNIPFTFANNDVSFDMEIPYTYTIKPVTIKAKVKDDTRLYGDSNPQFSSTYSGFVNDEDESVITSNGSYTTEATEMSDIGTYAIKQSGATAQNYVFEYEEGTLTVNKAPLTMTANDKSITYGSSIPTLDAKYEGLKNNETVPVWTNSPEFATTATQTSKVGTYPITISNADTKNYKLTVNNGSLTIEKADLTVSAENVSRLYGDANPEFTLTYTGLKNDETAPEWEKAPVVESTATIESHVGDYPISIKDAVAINYNIDAVEGTLTIKKAVLQVTVNDVTRQYGEDNPQFTMTYTGLKNGETAPEWITEPDITTTATKESSVGDYTIQETTAEALNYTLEKSAGVLSITKAPLTIVVNDCSRKYGEENPTFTLNYTGLLNDETTPEWTELPTITTIATAKHDVGEYAITASDGIMKNYETKEITSGVLTVTSAPLTIKVNDATRQYYSEEPNFSYKCEGFVNNDNEEVLTSKPTLTTSATLSSDVGTYPIKATGASNPNYSISYVDGTLNITQRTLEASVENYQRVYNEENPTFEVKYNGFVGNDNESTLITKPIVSTTATKTSNVGTYPINISDGSADNYKFTYISGYLTINKAEQTMLWEQNLNDLRVGSQVELKAVASSGLPISYTIDNSSAAELYSAGPKTYLDCKGDGQFSIRAVQNGDTNYYSSQRVVKIVTINNGVLSETYVWGDINCDGVVNAADITKLVNMIMGR